MLQELPRSIYCLLSDLSLDWASKKETRIFTGLIFLFTHEKTVVVEGVLQVGVSGTSFRDLSCLENVLNGVRNRLEYRVRGRKEELPGLPASGRSLSD